jgi:hypothetical protein
MFMRNAEREHGECPLPLVSTRYELTLDAWLAVVTATRTFRNNEPRSIEATMTFPMPVRAALFEIVAKIDDRTLKAVAMERGKSRGTYEKAIERGKTAVLHEELLPGIHMLSVAPLPPGKEIEVTMSWATTLTLIDGLGHLRIPLTVGDVYGQSGLPDSDELIHGGPVQSVQVSVHCINGSAEILGKTLIDNRTEVPSNAAIDITVRGWSPRTLVGRTSDGREVSLRIEPRNSGTAPLDVAILVDHSGSMSETAGANLELTKHQAVVVCLNELANSLTDSDRVQLIEFADAPKSVLPNVDMFTRLRAGAAPISSRDKLNASIKNLSPPDGGTEIGAALAYALQAPEAHDVLLITDGKSHSLDVQALAQYGKRISVVLVGEDSFEANVGRLALLSGGDLFVTHDLQGAIHSAIKALKSPFERSSEQSSEIEAVTTISGNAAIIAHWGIATQEPEAPQTARAVAAIATFLAMPALCPEAATKAAEQEGLVTHLTSLVLVDEESQVEDSLPATRKIALPMPKGVRSLHPHLNLSSAAHACDSASFPETSESLIARFAPSFQHRDKNSRLPKWLSPSIKHSRPENCADKIDWDVAPNELAAGDLSSLQSEIRDEILRIARTGKVLAMSRLLQIDPIRIVIATMALAAASRSRSADRIARNILGGDKQLAFEEMASALIDTIRP